MKVTLVPWQTVPEGKAVTAIVTGVMVVTDVTMVLDVAGLPLVQVRLDVKIHRT